VLARALERSQKTAVQLMSMRPLRPGIVRPGRSNSSWSPAARSWTGSGPGLIAEPLAERGYRVVAVDNSPEMLAYLSRAVPVLGDIEVLELGERFSLHIVGCVDEVTGQQNRIDRFLATAARHVKASGRVVV
jgi:SAM-dependent methyltransferase